MKYPAILLSSLVLGCSPSEANLGQQNKDRSPIVLSFDESMVLDSILSLGQPFVEVKVPEEENLVGPFVLLQAQNDHIILHDLATEEGHLLSEHRYLNQLGNRIGNVEFSRIIEVGNAGQDSLAILVDGGDRIVIFNTALELKGEIPLDERCKSFSFMESGLIVRPVDPVGVDENFIVKVYQQGGSCIEYEAPLPYIKIPAQEKNFKRHPSGLTTYTETFNHCIYKVGNNRLDSLICFDFAGKKSDSLQFLSDDVARYRFIHREGYFRIIDYDDDDEKHETILAIEHGDETRYFVCQYDVTTMTQKNYALPSHQVPIANNVYGKVLTVDKNLLLKQRKLVINQFEISNQ